MGSSAGLLTGAIVDVELAAKFQEELALETESGETEELPESVKYFLDNGPFEVNIHSLFAIELALTGNQIIDKAGEEEVVLTRKFGDEKYAYRRTL